MKPAVELFIPAAPKDYGKLPFVLASVAEHVREIQTVHITTPTTVKVGGAYPFDVIYHADRDVLDYDLTRFKFRPTWIYQQFLKLFQTVTASEWYLVMDADKIWNRPQTLFTADNQPIMFLSNQDQNHGPYFEYSDKMLGIRREFNHSFLSEATLYNRSLVHGMLAGYAGLQDWLDRSAAIIDATCCPADAELYGNYVYHYWPELYAVKHITDDQRGKYQGEWTPDELRTYIAQMKSAEHVDILSAHSWHD